MIPPEPSNHASFLELVPQSGLLVMAWFSGTSEGADKCSIVTAHLLANTSQWSNATTVAMREGYSNQNPVLYYDSNTNLLNLFHTQQKATLTGAGAGGGSDGGRGRVGNREDNAHIWRYQTTDMLGTSWKEPVEVFDKDGSFDRNRIIRSVVDGSLIFPIYFSCRCRYLTPSNP